MPDTPEPFNRRAVDVTLREHIESICAELSRRITEGDRELRQHVQNQVEQIRLALESAEHLEVERLEALRREMSIITDASSQAINKAEAATEKRFEAVNEWRGQSADRERSQQEQSGILMSTFMPREVAEAQLSEVRRSVADLTEKVGKLL
jgi:hypothetical protein